MPRCDKRTTRWAYKVKNVDHVDENTDDDVGDYGKPATRKCDNKAINIVPHFVSPTSAKMCCRPPAVGVLSPLKGRLASTSLHYIVGRNDTFYHAVRLRERPSIPPNAKTRPTVCPPSGPGIVKGKRIS